MFYLDYVGSRTPATIVAAVTAMTSSAPTTQDQNLMLLAEALALSAVQYGASAAPTDNVHLQIRGGFETAPNGPNQGGTGTLQIKWQTVALTSAGVVRTGDPTYRMSP